MAKKIFILFMALALALAIGFGAQLYAEDAKYVIGTSADWPPFEWKDSKGNFVGFDIDVMRMIAHINDYEIKVMDMAFDGLPAALSSGKIDIIVAGWSITEERKKIMEFTDSYWSNDQSVMVKKASKLTKKEALDNNHKIGAQTGSTQAKWLEKKAKEGMAIKLEQYETNDLGVMDLVSGRIDAFMADEPVAKAFTDSYPIKIVGVVETNERLGFSVAKGDPNGLLPKLNSGIKKLQEEGIWDILVAAYSTGNLKKIDDAFKSAYPLMKKGDLAGYSKTLHTELTSK